MWFAREHGGEHLAGEPIQPFLVRKMPDTPQEQHSFRLASSGAKFVPRRRDPGAIIVNPPAQFRQERYQVVGIIGTAPAPDRSAAGPAAHSAARANTRTPLPPSP